MATAVSLGLGLAAHSCADDDSDGARRSAYADAGITATTSRSDLAARAAIHAYILAAYAARAAIHANCAVAPAIHAYILAAYAAAPAIHAYADTSVETDLPADADIPAFSG